MREYEWEPCVDCGQCKPEVVEDGVCDQCCDMAEVIGHFEGESTKKEIWRH